ncbi:insulinase family protein [Streptomyces sp. NPDC059373]
MRLPLPPVSPLRQILINRKAAHCRLLSLPLPCALVSRCAVFDGTCAGREFGRGGWWAVPGDGYTLSHREMQCLRLFNTVLGGSASSRLSSRIRDREGLSYRVRSVWRRLTLTWRHAALSVAWKRT